MWRHAKMRACLAVSAALFWLWPVSATAACDCAPVQSPLEELEQRDAVFSGKVRSGPDLEAPGEGKKPEPVGEAKDSPGIPGEKNGFRRAVTGAVLMGTAGVFIMVGRGIKKS